MIITIQYLHYTLHQESPIGHVTLKVPKCEIFDPFFLLINSIWVADLRTGFFLRMLSVRKKESTHKMRKCKYDITYTSLRFSLTTGLSNP